MTYSSPEERAEEVIRWQRRTYMNFGDQVEYVAKAIREAIEAERSECVKICDEAANDLDDEGNAFFAVIGVRDAIRSRSEKP